MDRDLPNGELDKRVDWIGAVLTVPGVVFIMFALGQGGLAPQEWKTPCKSLCNNKRTH